METKELFNFEAFKQEAIKGLYAGQPINGEKGIFAPLLTQLLEAALEGEMSAHLDREERQQGNRRNGKTSKVVKSAAGEFALSTPHDRSGSFEPLIVPKRQVVISEEPEEKVISLYGMDMSFRDIAAHIKEMYSMDISAATLSSITDGPQIRFDLRSKSFP